MQLPLSDGRAVRMIEALLAAADPLDRMVGDGTAASYGPLASAVLAALRNGADARRIVMLISEHAEGGTGEAAVLGQTVAFAEATADWWASAQSRWMDPVAI